MDGSLEASGLAFVASFNAIRGWHVSKLGGWHVSKLVTFREDENRVRNRTTANNLVWLKRFALSLLKQQTDRHNVAMRRRVAGWNIDYLAQLFGIPTV